MEFFFLVVDDSVAFYLANPVEIALLAPQGHFLTGKPRIPKTDRLLSPGNMLFDNVTCELHLRFELYAFLLAFLLATVQSQAVRYRQVVVYVQGGYVVCLLYTSDAADDLLCVDLCGRRII